MRLNVISWLQVHRKWFRFIEKHLFKQYCGAIVYFAIRRRRYCRCIVRCEFQFTLGYFATESSEVQKWFKEQCNSENPLFDRNIEADTQTYLGQSGIKSNLILARKRLGKTRVEQNIERRKSPPTCSFALSISEIFEGKFSSRCRLQNTIFTQKNFLSNFNESKMHLIFRWWIQKLCSRFHNSFHAAMKFLLIKTLRWSCMNLMECSGGNWWKIAMHHPTTGHYQNFHMRIARPTAYFIHSTINFILLHWVLSSAVGAYIWTDWIHSHFSSNYSWILEKKWFHFLFSIIGLYSTYILLTSKFFRQFLASKVSDIIREDLPYVDRILQLCSDIYLVREQGEFQLEEDLYAKLIFLYRSPETLIRWTRMPDVEHAVDSTCDIDESDAEKALRKSLSHRLIWK